jgi:SPP1 family predicted phage head-tail adaptor
MHAGALKHRITIQQKTDTPDAFGQPISAWSNLVELWAHVMFVNGKEAIKSEIETSSKKASARIRYRSDIDTSMRVIFETETYNILSVLPDANKRHLDLVIETGLNNG